MRYAQSIFFVPVFAKSANIWLQKMALRVPKQKLWEYFYKPIFSLTRTPLTKKKRRKMVASLDPWA